MSNDIAYEEDGISSFVQMNDNGEAYAKVGIASFGRLGVIRTGNKDFAKIGIPRSVYVDDIDGIAKVNVMTELGAGFYDDAYDTVLTIDLSAEPESASGKCKFLDNEINCSEFGNNMWKSEYTASNAFTVIVVYFGKGKSTYDGKSFQVICDGRAVCTFNPKSSMTSDGKLFIDSRWLGSFAGENLNFAVVSDSSSLDDDKIMFLIKYLEREA